MNTHKPIVVCVINLKGGVGKSTIAALLSRAAYSTYKKDVLTIDLDPQANLSQALHPNYSQFLRDQNPSIVEIFLGHIPPSGTNYSARNLAPSDVTVRLHGNDSKSLELIPSRFDFSDNLLNAIRPNPTVLASFLANYFQRKDLIIIDCSPTESILTHAAYHASAFVLVPVKPEFFATIGFPLLQQSLSKFSSANRGQTIKVLGVVINNGFYHGGNDGGPEKARALKEIKAEATKNNWPIFSNELPYSRGFPKLMRRDYSHSGNAVGGFEKFAKEFFDLLDRQP